MVQGSRFAFSSPTLWIEEKELSPIAEGERPLSSHAWASAEEWQVKMEPRTRAPIIIQQFFDGRGQDYRGGLAIAKIVPVGEARAFLVAAGRTEEYAVRELGRCIEPPVHLVGQVSRPITHGRPRTERRPGNSESF